MDMRELIEHPISSIRDWVLSHERALGVGLSWGLALVFLIVAVIFFGKTVGIL